MYFAIGKPVDEPAVDRTKTQVAGFGPAPRLRQVIEHPGELCGREVGIDDQAGIAAHVGLPARTFELVTVLGGATILPYDSLTKWLTGISIPQQGSLTLVGDAYGSDFRCPDTCLLHHPASHGQLR